VYQGWKEYTAKDKSFTVWLPEDQGKKVEKLKNQTPKKGTTLRFTTVAIEGKDGRAYEASTVTVMPYQGEFTKLKSTIRVDIIRDLFVGAAKGKLGDEKELKQGRVPERVLHPDRQRALPASRVQLCRSVLHRVGVRDEGASEIEGGGRFLELLQDPGALRRAAREGRVAVRVEHR
jgi:hypothetical protein